MRMAATYLIGLLFGSGIVLSGMANPAKVLNFFDVFGAWDPSLMFVMGGAVVTTFVGYRLVLALQAPLIAPRFMLPTATAIDRRLLFGAGLFGIGWGIAGFCPGGALPAIGTGRPEVFIFVAGLGIGIVATRLVLANGEVPPRAMADSQS